jgi:uncharacterized metal-binding protein YceD (DUF177 family)
MGCESPGLEPQCNKEVLKHLTAEKKIKAEDTDPRWAVLKNLKN